MATDFTTSPSALSSSDPEVDFPYRALNRSAIAAILLFVVSLIGLIPPFEAVLALAVLGLLVAFFAFRAIKRYPNEYSGLGLAKFGILANLLVLIGGIGFHAYTYATEVPPGHVRVPFYTLKFDGGDNIPDRPTPDALDVNGQDVFIKGYIHPSSGGGMLRQFVLVGDLGTCCFGGQPKSSEMIEVTLMGGQTVKGGLTRRKVAGKFSVNQVPTTQADFDNAVFYRLKGKKLK